MFGIIHGVTEFLSMLINSKLYPDLNPKLISLTILFNAVSYLYLLAFGIAISDFKYKVSRTVKISLIIFSGLALVLYVYIIIFHQNYINEWGAFISLLIRYFVALPANIITAKALYKNSNFLKKIKLDAIVLRIRLLSLSFLLYAFLSGVFVKKAMIFPASVINSELFESLFGFPVEIARAGTAIIIMILFISIKEIFNWETNQIIRKLTKEQTIAEERKKLALQVHDVVIQNIYATGLQVEHLLKNEKDSYKNKKLEDIKNGMNNSIVEMRNYINNIIKREIGFEDIRLKLQELINKLQNLYPIMIILDYHIPSFTPGNLSSERLTEVYLIMQEAIYNSIKHAEASKVKVSLSITENDVIALVSDDGKGFNEVEKNKSNSYGLYSMKERAIMVGGRLIIKSSTRGTSVCLEVPWEVNLDEAR